VSVFFSVRSNCFVLCFIIYLFVCLEDGFKFCGSVTILEIPGKLPANVADAGHINVSVVPEIVVAAVC